MAKSRRKRSDARTRTGCNKCRLRRVKCPEQKPACTPCLKLGFDCTYDQGLRWQTTPLFEVDSLEVAQVPAPQTESWMFLSAFAFDFDPDVRLGTQCESDSDSEAGSPDLSHEIPLFLEGSEASESSSKQLDVRHAEAPGVLRSEFDRLPLLSSLRLSRTESYLWEYFHNAIAPACVLNPARNPYQDVILRIAATTSKASPLFSSIMAISASQLAILGARRFYVPSCTYRQKALQGLREQTSQIEGNVKNQSVEAQVIATAMALVFLDILSDCSESWVVHSNFARAQICRLRERSESLDPDLCSLLDFVGGYIVAHEVYAHTAWDAERTAGSGDHVTSLSDDANLRTLTGCSTEFFQILSDVNTLVANHTEYSKSDYPDPNVLAALDDRRRDLERQLQIHAIHDSTYDGYEMESPEDISESVLALDIKRLTALLHMRSRIDHLGPDDQCVAELGTRILRLIARVPTRSNIILWPLFMVATLGIGPHCDEERVFILQKLDALQRQRQMRYIKKARRIITNVWKLRDAGDANTRVGWGILKEVTRQERISLL